MEKLGALTCTHMASCTELCTSWSLTANRRCCCSSARQGVPAHPACNLDSFFFGFVWLMKTCHRTWFYQPMLPRKTIGASQWDLSCAEHLARGETYLQARSAWSNCATCDNSAASLSHLPTLLPTHSAHAPAAPSQRLSSPAPRRPAQGCRALENANAMLAPAHSASLYNSSSLQKRPLLRVIPPQQESSDLSQLRVLLGCAARVRCEASRRSSAYAWQPGAWRARSPQRTGASCMCLAASTTASLSRHTGPSSHRNIYPVFD